MILTAYNWPGFSLLSPSRTSEKAPLDDYVRTRVCDAHIWWHGKREKGKNKVKDEKKCLIDFSLSVLWILSGLETIAQVFFPLFSTEYLIHYETLDNVRLDVKDSWQNSLGENGVENISNIKFPLLQPICVFFCVSSLSTEYPSCAPELITSRDGCLVSEFWLMFKFRRTKVI